MAGQMLGRGCLVASRLLGVRHTAALPWSWVGLHVGHIMQLMM